MEHNFVILRGLPGAGKTRLVRKLAHPRGAVVSADDFWLDAHGKYSFDPAHLDEAHAACFRAALLATRRHTPQVVVDNTNTTAVEIAPYYLLAQATGYNPVIIEVACDPNAAFDRQAHGVSLKVFSTMAAQLGDPLPPWWAVERIESGE